MPYIKDRKGNVFNSGGDRPGAAFRSGTQRFKDKDAPGPGFKYAPLDRPVLEHDHLTASAASAFVSKTPRFRDGKAMGPGMKYNDPIDHSKDDPNVVGAVAAFRSRTPRLPDTRSPTSQLPPSHYRASYPTDIGEVAKTIENVPSAPFRSKAARFKDKPVYYGPKVLDLKDPREISQTCAPRENPKGVGFTTSAPRFTESKDKPIPLRSSAFGTIAFETAEGTSGGAISAFRSKSSRFAKTQAPYGDRILDYKHPLDIQTKVGEYMAR